MARRKYYKKKSYRKRNYNKNHQEIDPVTWFVLWVGLFSFMTYNMFIKENIDNIVFFLKIFVPILFISAGLIIYYLHKKREKIKQERIDSFPNFILELEDKIKNFKPLRNYNKEEPYQIELAGFLKNNYPTLDIEKSIHYSRPDIVIDNIAIEIKWPTHMSWLKTLPDKINSYIQKRDYLFIVLFNIDIVPDKEKNIQIYEDKKREILENTLESKREKLFFIEINW